MARLKSIGFELNSATNLVEVKEFSVNTVSTTHTRSGTYAMKILVAAGTSYMWESVYASNQANILYVRVYIYIVTTPSANSRIIWITNTAGGTRGAIALKTDNTLELRAANNTVLGSPTAALNKNTWYRVEIAYDASVATDTLEGRLNGVSFATGNNSTNGDIAGAFFGFLDTTTSEVWMDDIAFNDNTGSFQNSWPGDGKIIHLRPNAAGDSAQWTPTSGANYTNVDEVTPNDATDLLSDSVLNDSDLYNVDNSGIGSTDQVNVVQLGVRFRNDVADATTQFKVQTEKTTGGTISQSAAITPNSVTWKTNATAIPINHPLTLYQDPDSSNWTQSTLDTMQIGVQSTLIGVNKNQVSTIWALIDYSTYNTITTLGLTNISLTTATANGTTTDGLDPSKRGFVYDTVTRSAPGDVAPGSSGYSSYIEETGTLNLGTFTGSLTGLTSSTKYFIRAYAYSAVGYVYGAEINFITSKYGLTNYGIYLSVGNGESRSESAK